jgi:biotin synthase
MVVLDLEAIRNKSLGGESLSREECLGVINYPDERLAELMKAVLFVRELYKGRKVSAQILTNAKSGGCDQDCKYCAQSCLSKANIDKYQFIEYEKMLTTGRVCAAKKAQHHCIGLSGVYFTDEQIDNLCENIRKLKNDTGTRICCSIGFLTREQAVKLKTAGVNRINHNLNTGKNFYKNICATHSYEQRINNIKMLKEVGFELCCGGIIGLGESNDDIIDMLFEIRTIAPESVPINFLLPIKGTPFEGNNIEKLTTEYCLKTLALARLLNPKADVRCAAGREAYIKDKHDLMFCAVNSIFASGYLTAPGQAVDETIKMIRDAGFEYEGDD